MTDFSVHANGATNGTPPEAPSDRTAPRAYEFREHFDTLRPIEQLHAILHHFPDPLEWLYAPQLHVLAQFRYDPPEVWGQVCEYYRRLGGNLRTLDETVARWLAAEEEERQQAETGVLTDAVVSFEELMALTIPPREEYLPWLQERSLVMLYGPRGVGKTMALLGLALSLAAGRPFLRWPVTRPIGVLYVDGEMALDELRGRAATLTGGMPPLTMAFLSSELVYRRSGLSLTLTPEYRQREIETILDARPAIQILVLDNVSCLFPGISEDKKQDWEPINAWLIRMRHRGITVMLGHHAGKSGQQRGTSAREDALDAVIALSVPPNHAAEDGCHFYWRFEKARGVTGETVAGLDVRLEQTPAGLEWTFCPLEASRTERIKTMLREGIPIKAIAEELDVHLSYVYRLKNQLDPHE